MERFSAASFFQIAQHLTVLSEAVEADVREGGHSAFDPDSRLVFLNTMVGIDAACRALGLSVSLKAVRQLTRLIEKENASFSSLGPAVEMVKNSIRWEMEDILFFHMPPDRASRFNHAASFGLQVSKVFPSIEFDLVEAGNCYAAGRGTASVFHLMRVMEIGVQSLGGKLGVPLVVQKNWQSILDEVNKAIKALPPKDNSTVQLAQAASNLYSVKLAWRNEVMHPKQTYTLEEAESIMRCVKSFMVQMAAMI